MDTQFWQRVLWPEGEVFWFNTVLNKSSEWGTSPFLWYFYSALPRAMGFSVFLVPIGMWLEPRCRVLAIPCLAFVLAFSLLPHKELRFIIYVFPFLNVAAAATCARFWMNRGKSVWQYLLNVIGCGHLLGNVLVTLFLLLIAGTNYPGGVAMSRLHRLVEGPDGGGGGDGGGPRNVTVHIGNFAAQSGVSRFTEIHGEWRYFKEDLTLKEINEREFSHLLVEAKSKHSSELKFLQGSYSVLEFVECFDQIGIQYKSLLPVTIKRKPCVYILQRKKKEDIVKVEEERIKEQWEVKEKESIAEVKEEIKEKEEEIAEEPLKEIKEPLKPKEAEAQEQPAVVKTPRHRNNKLTSELVKEIIRKQQVQQKMKQIKTEMSSNQRKEQQQLENDKPNLSKVIKGNRISNIRKTIKTEEIRHMAEEIAKLDMSQFCDLETLSTKECLRKIIDELDITSSGEVVDDEEDQVN